MSATRPPAASSTSAHMTCPFCRSEKVTTTSKSTTDDAYWRCGACGQIWNPTRLAVARNGWAR